MGDSRRVVVTAMGVISSLGFERETMWKNMLAGKTGIDFISAFDTSDYRVKIASEVDSGQFADQMKARNIRRGDRTLQMAIHAAHDALQEADLLDGNQPKARENIGVIFGTGIGSQHTLYEGAGLYFEKGVRGIRPTSIPRAMANAISAQISMRNKLTGPNYVVVSACTSSTNAIGVAFRMVRDGYADRVLCGGADATFEPMIYGAWDKLGVMSKNADPQAACRPFDVDRDGCVLGEGAGALMLETEQGALERGATIHAELSGYGESSDAGHITRPNPDGQAAAISSAIRDAGIATEDIGYINAHGTGTPSNDESECKAIRMALGASAEKVAVGANKSFFGHTLGASGAIETIVTIMGLNDKKVPPNLNLDNPDPACDLEFVGKKPRDVTSPVALKNSFGFGGGNGVLVIRRWEK